MTWYLSSYYLPSKPVGSVETVSTVRLWNLVLLTQLWLKMQTEKIEYVIFWIHHWQLYIHPTPVFRTAFNWPTVFSDTYNLVHFYKKIFICGSAYKLVRNKLEYYFPHWKFAKFFGFQSFWTQGAKKAPTPLIEQAWSIRIPNRCNKIQEKVSKWVSKLSTLVFFRIKKNIFLRDRAGTIPIGLEHMFCATQSVVTQRSHLVVHGVQIRQTSSR